jgi:hypothetical protein
VGADSGRSFGAAAAILGGFIGAPAGLALSLLHWRLVMWLLGPTEPEAPTTMARTEAWICEQVYKFGMLFGSLSSWLGTFLAVAFLLRSRPARPSEMSRSECVELFFSIAFCGYVVLWGTQRLVNWMVSRHRR